IGRHDHRRSAGSDHDERRHSSLVHGDCGSDVHAGRRASRNLPGDRQHRLHGQRPGEPDRNGLRHRQRYVVFASLRFFEPALRGRFASLAKVAQPVALSKNSIPYTTMAQPATNPKIEELRFRIKTDPKSRLFYQLAEELRKVKSFDEAEEVLRAGLTHNPTYLAAWVSLGRTLREKDKHQDSIEAFTKALQIDPGNVVAARL